MILIIDNYDSFTYNLVQQIETLGYDVEVVPNDQLSLEEIHKKSPSKIIISPGPGNPDDAGISSQVIKKFYKTIPILGVCLGHQCIGKVFGASITHAPQVMHGKTSPINHSGSGLFKNLPPEFLAARYHSLTIENIIKPLEVTATTEDGTIMAIAHREFPLYGVQFHPESFLTPSGKLIMRNFLK